MVLLKGFEIYCALGYVVPPIGILGKFHVLGGTGPVTLYYN